MRTHNKKIAHAIALAVSSAWIGAVAWSVEGTPLTPIDYDSRLPVAADSALASVSGQVDPAIKEIVLVVGGDAGSAARLVADGLSVVPVRIRVTDSQGRPLAGRRVVRIAIDGASLRRLEGAEECRVEERGRRCADEEVAVINGEGAFGIAAPSSAREVFVSARIGGRETRSALAFEPEQRDFIAAGLVEAVVNIDRAQKGGLGTMPGLSDAFERDLRRWESTFNNGKGSFAGRSTFFMKGTDKNGYLITAMFDSEKDLRTREFRDVNPDRYYPVMGDAAQRGYEAKSSDRMYLRVDKGRSYFLYGDFATGSEFSLAADGARLAPLRTVDLGQYNRSMTGLRWHQDTAAGYVDVWSVRDSLRQAVEEYRGNGTSGPFAVGNYNALENSEKLEVIVRDRNNTSRILSTTALERYIDYTFEPFSGRVVLKAPLPSLDSQLNPISLRITYEVDTGGEEFWTHGVSAQRRLAPWLQAGVGYVLNDSTGLPAGSGYSTTPGSGFAELRELRSANLTFGRGELGSLVVEVAEAESFSQAELDLIGTAWRFDWRIGRGEDRAAQGERWDLRIYGGEADEEFVNSASSLAPGRTEYALQAAAELGASARIAANGSVSEDAFTTGERTGASVRLERDLTDRVTIDAGVRYFSQRNGGVLSLSSASWSLVMPGQGPAYGGSGLNPNGAGFWGMGVGLDPFTGQPQNAFNGSALVNPSSVAPDLDVTSFSLGLRTRINEAWTVGVEAGQDQGFENDPTWGAVTSDYTTEKARAFARVESPTGRATAGLDYRVSEATALYGRWEETNGLGSVYSVDDSSRGQAIVLGLRRAASEGTDAYSEVRMREGMNDRDLESVTGIRQSFALSERVEANVMAERLEILEGASRSATALGGGLGFGDRLWQGDARLEWRRLDRDSSAIVDNSTDSVMSTLSLARKLGGDWTGLVRNYVLMTDDESRAGDQFQNRFQLGAAYRPLGRNNFDLLLRYENKRERNSELALRESRTVDIVSASFNLHPSRKLWVSGRVAAKDLDETLVGVQDDYQAWLVASRVILDLGQRFDVSVMGGVMGTPDDDAREETYGLEIGYRVKENIWLSAGHNFAGFSDRDLAGREQTEEGWYVRLRMKFDEALFARR